MSSVPGSGRSPGNGNRNPLRYSFLDYSMNRGAWPAAVHGVAEWTRLSNWACARTHAHARARTHTHTHTPLRPWNKTPFPAVCVGSDPRKERKRKGKLGREKGLPSGYLCSHPETGAHYHIFPFSKCLHRCNEIKNLEMRGFSWTIRVDPPWHHRWANERGRGRLFTKRSSSEQTRGWTDTDGEPKAGSRRSWRTREPAALSFSSAMRTSDPVPSDLWENRLLFLKPRSLWY